MTTRDAISFAWGVVTLQRVRTSLMILAIAIGVGAVIILTSIGEGARRYVVNQFSQLGTNLLVIFPGRSETTGIAGMLVTRVPRDLTIADAQALQHIRGVTRAAPIAIGAGDLQYEARSRETQIIGTTADWIYIRRMTVSEGSFLPTSDPRESMPVCVLGAKVRTELFGTGPAIGQSVRIGDRRFRVIGVIASHGPLMGFDFDEIVVIPVGAALALFDSSSLARIVVESHSREDIQEVEAQITDVLRKRHEGELDVTVLTEDAILGTFDRILVSLTLAIAGIGAISITVSGILIMNLMLIAISQRRQEIGLLKAVGATSLQVRALFFAEALVLSGMGVLGGALLGESGSWLLRRVFPTLPAHAPYWAVLLACTVAIVTAVVFTVLPARKASLLDPVVALARR